MDPHQIITARSAPEASRARSMSSMSISASSMRVVPDLVNGPSSFFTYSRSKTAGMGRISDSSSRSESSSAGSRTPALRAAMYASSSNTSQAAKDRSSSGHRGAKSRISGVRPSVRRPSRMVPICVTDPTGAASPLRIAWIPAMKVVLTAPRPGSSTRRPPVAGLTSNCCFVMRAAESMAGKESCRSPRGGDGRLRAAARSSPGRPDASGRKGPDKTLFSSSPPVLPGGHRSCARAPSDFPSADS